MFREQAAEKEGPGLNSDSALSFMDIIIIGCGLYLLYGYYLLMAKNEIKTGLILSKGADPSKCKDLEGYKKYIGPKLLLFAIGAIVCGSIGPIQTYVFPIPMPVYWIVYVLFLGVLIWFAKAAKEGEKRFFGGNRS